MLVLIVWLTGGVFVLTGSWDSSMTAGQHMGSRIAQLMASNSLCNSYTAFNTNYKDTGLFGIYAVGSPETAEDMGWTMINNMTKMVYSVRLSQRTAV
jgi:processing peptidase subunit beta